jgi:hypothetical protein
MKTYTSNVDHVGDVPYMTGKKEIRLYFDVNDLVSGSDVSYQDVDGFDVSIAWLNSGNDIANLGGLPQKFEVITYGHTGTGSRMQLQHSTTYDDDVWKNTPYRSTGVEGFWSQSNLRFVVRIVLDEENPRSENYGQMVLGLDIRPRMKW